MSTFKFSFQKVFLTVATTSALCAQNAFAASETSAGLIVSQFTPKHSATLKGDPELPTTMLTKGVHASYLKNGVLLGGRAWYGSARANNNTSGSHVSVGSIGGLVGWGLSSKVFDCTIGTSMGIGTVTYSLASATAPLVLEASFVSVEPLATVGFLLSNTFKMSLGGGYQVGYVHEVTQNGPAEFHLDKPHEKVTVGGMSIFAQFSFVIQ